MIRNTFVIIIILVLVFVVYLLFFVLLAFLTACTPVTACPSNTCLLHAHIIEMWYDNYATHVYLSVLPVSVCVWV